MGHIQIRISDEEKKQVKKILENMGLTYSSAIKLFFKKTLQQGKIPFDISASFEVKLPKEKPLKQIKKTPESIPQTPSWNPFKKRRIGS